MIEIKRYFTPQDANRTLPLVRRIVEDILATGREIRELESNPPAGARDTREKHRTLLNTLQSYRHELEDIGCFFKDWNFEMGLVDFPARINGRDVFLCWRSDEPELMFYHGVQENFQNRKPIPPALLAIPAKRG